MAKQLWLHSLADLTPARILAGGRRAIRSTEFLPNLSSLRRYCNPQPADLGLPDAHAAYIEACRAPSPKAEQHWSHPAVYHAGRASDWFFLASSPESSAFPVFKRNYELLVQRVLEGEDLDVPIPKALPDEITTPLSAEQRRERLARLREELGI